MTKKDYELIADGFNNALAAIKDKEPLENRQDLLDGVSYAVDYVTEQLQQENTRFDRDKFLTACGIESNDFEQTPERYRVDFDEQD